MNSRITILYVDDEALNLMVFKTVLKTNYNIITAESGFEGLEELSANPDIQIVITDMRMPGMSGLEFINIAKEKYPDIIFCMLTGYEITEEIKGAINSKLIYKYFQKPYNVEEINNALWSVINKNQQSSINFILKHFCLFLSY
jgi:two-component system, response regulator, stage 0 sporulation protein F